MATIQLEIVSPDKLVYTADIAMLIVRSTGGELGILPHHAPLVTGLIPHVMRVKFEDREQLIAVAGGFMEVQPAKITILASAAELPIDIDVNRAKQAYKRTNERLEAFKQSPEQLHDFDASRAQAALARAKARLVATKTDIE